MSLWRDSPCNSHPAHKRLLLLVLIKGWSIKFTNAHLTACPGLKPPQSNFSNYQTSEIALAILQFFSIAKTLKPIGWTKFSVAWTHVANCAVCCQYLKLFHMVKHNLQISLRLFSKTLNTFSVSKHILHSNAHVIHTGKHKWQQSNTNIENMSLIKHNHSKLISLVSNDVTQPI